MAQRFLCSYLKFVINEGLNVFGSFLFSVPGYGALKIYDMVEEQGDDKNPAPMIRSDLLSTTTADSGGPKIASSNLLSTATADSSDPMSTATADSGESMSTATVDSGDSLSTVTAAPAQAQDVPPSGDSPSVPVSHNYDGQPDQVLQRGMGPSSQVSQQSNKISSLTLEIFMKNWKSWT